MKFWQGMVAGFVSAIALLIVGAYGYFASGMAPVATAAQPMPFEKFLASRAQRAAIGAAAKTLSPVPADEANLLGGARLYRDNCAVCHGLPGQEESAIAKGMFPKVPQLFKGHGVTDDPVGETFWKVQNGIRLTGMPAFKGSLSTTEMWQVSQVLAHADQLPQTVRAALSGNR